MTFRDFSKITRKETDNISEHNFSVISNRDIENINEITIVFTEERQSDAYRSSLVGGEGVFFPNDETHEKTYNNMTGNIMPINIGMFASGNQENPVPNQEIRPKSYEISTTANVVSKSNKMFSEMDDYLTRKNKVSGIKI
jgi:hypothetical protein